MMTNSKARNVKQPAWFTNTLLGLAQILVWGGSFFLMAILADPVSKDTGWSHQYVYGSLSIGILVSGLLAPWVGKQIAGQKGKAMLRYSGLAMGFGLLIVAIAPVLMIFMFGWFIIGIGMAMGLYDSLFAVLGREYGSGAKKAITHITLISGFVTTVIWPLLAWMINHMGWRHTCLAYALLLALAIWPLYKLALPGKEPDNSLIASDTSPAVINADPSFKSVVYWLLAFNFTIAAIIMTGISVQLLDVLQAKGLSLFAAISIGTLIGPFQVGVRVLDLVGPKKHPIWNAFISATLVLIGLVLLGLDSAFAAAGVVLYSLGNGMRAILRGTLPLELFDPIIYPEVMGRLARPALIAQAITPVIGAYIVHQYGAMSLLVILAALALVNIGLTVAIKFYMNRLLPVTQ